MPLVHVFLKWRGLGSAWLCNGRANFNDFVALHILAAVKLSLRHVLPHFYKASSSSRPFLYSLGVCYSHKISKLSITISYHIEILNIANNPCMEY